MFESQTMDWFIVNADDPESDRRIGYGGIEAQQAEGLLFIVSEQRRRY